MNGEKVFVALDVKNLLRVCKSVFGPSYRVDYKKIMEAIVEDVKPSSDIKAIAYISLSKRVNPADISFAAALGKIGYSVKKQTFIPRVRIGIDLMSETDWVSGITTDILERFYYEGYNHFIVITGDNDYRYLGNFLVKKSNKVGIYSFSYPSLYENNASYIRKMNKGYLFSVSRRHREEDDNNNRYEEEEPTAVI